MFSRKYFYQVEEFSEILFLKTSWFLIICGLCFVLRLDAQEALSPALVPDPEIKKILDGLGDNSSAMLPAAKLVGDFGEIAKKFKLDKTGPEGRDFSIKMVWVPERKRAFYCGANHGGPHRLNDAWEYDLPSNTWVLLFDPDYNDRRDKDELLKAGVKLDKDGFLVTEKGAPSNVGHTWWGLTYDPQLKAAIWVSVWMNYSSQMERLGIDKSVYSKAPPLFAFFPETKKWQSVPTEGPYPNHINMGAGSLEYIPDLQASFWYHRDTGTWLFNSKKNAWTNLKPNMNGLKTIGYIENVMCYDTKHKILVSHRGDSISKNSKDNVWRVLDKRTYHYDIVNNSWSLILEALDTHVAEELNFAGKHIRKDTEAVQGVERVSSDSVPGGHDGRTLFYYDPNGEICLLVDRASQEIWSYSVPEKKWTKLEPQGAPMPKWGRAFGHFDPVRNVFVLHVDGRQAWVYRYKKVNK